MKKYRFILLMKRELFSEGETAEEARLNLIERMAFNDDEATFRSVGTDYLDEGEEIEREL